MQKMTKRHNWVTTRIGSTKICTGFSCVWICLVSVDGLSYISIDSSLKLVVLDIPEVKLLKFCVRWSDKCTLDEIHENHVSAGQSKF